MFLNIGSLVIQTVKSRLGHFTLIILLLRNKTFRCIQTHSKLKPLQKTTKVLHSNMKHVGIQIVTVVWENQESLANGKYSK